MRTTLTQKVDLETLKQDLKSHFTNYKIDHAPFNKKTIRLRDGMVQVIVGQRKNNEFFCLGNINLLDVRIFIPFIIGTVIGFIFGIAFLGIVMLVKKKKYTAMEEEIIAYLNDNQILT